MLKLLSSVRITVVCIFLLFVLTFWGTVAQVQQGLYIAQERFFNSFFFLAGGFFPFPGCRRRQRLRCLPLLISDDRNKSCDEADQSSIYQVLDHDVDVLMHLRCLLIEKIFILTDYLATKLGFEKICRRKPLFQALPALSPAPFTPGAMCYGTQIAGLMSDSFYEIAQGSSRAGDQTT